MTQPPQPLGRTPLNKPTPIATRAAETSTPSNSNGPKIDIKTLGAGLLAPRLNQPRERILLAGDTNSGKTYAYFAIAQDHFERETGAKFWLIDTDDTAPTYLADGYSFSHLYFENGGNVYPFFAPDWQTVARAGNTIISQATAGDWIIVDLASSAYAYAQEMIANLKGLNLDDEVVRRMGVTPGTRRLGFGAFDGDTWGLVTRTYEATMRPLINNPRTNFIGLSHVTDMQTTAGRETREPILLFDQLGMKPSGIGKLAKMVNTIAVLWSVRPLDQEKRSGEIARKMTVVKDRDQACHYTQTFTAFYPDLINFRKTVTKTRNITDPDEVEALTQAAKELLRGPDTPPETEGSAEAESTE